MRPLSSRKERNSFFERNSAAALLLQSTADLAGSGARMNKSEGNNGFVTNYYC